MIKIITILLIVSSVLGCAYPDKTRVRLIQLTTTAFELGYLCGSQGRPKDECVKAFNKIWVDNQ